MKKSLKAFGTRVCQWASANNTRVSLKYTLINAGRFLVDADTPEMQQVMTQYKKLQNLPQDWDLSGMVAGMKVFLIFFD